MSSPLIHALWMLCALGTTAFAAVAPRRRDLCAMASGFAAAALWFVATGAPDAGSVSGLTVVVAALVVVRPRAALIPATLAGILAAVWMMLLRSEGVPAAAAAAIAAALPATSAWLTARRPSFAPPGIREEATLLVLVLAAIVAAAPTLLAGWHSALALNLQPPAGTHLTVPGWALVLAGGAFGLGGLLSAWRRG